MKKRIIQAGYIGALLLFGGYAQAQVKVGDNPTTINANSALEVESTNKGLLVPRIALTGTTAASPMSAHVAGMTVYNTATAGTAPNNVTPGFYYNDGTRWVAVKDNYLTAEVDGIIGNEVTDVNAGKGLSRTGAGTAADPYKVGMTDGTATGQVMQWNGTAWTIVDGASVVPNATTLLLGKVQLAGDLAGTGTTATAPKVSGLQGTPVSATAPANGQILAFNGTSWVPTAASAASELDGIIGNEISDVVANKGLTRTGAGTDTDPYKVGMTDGTASGQILKWNGTAWALATDNAGIASEVDGIIGNEITDVTATGGLARTGAGTTVSPYLVGLKDGTATGQVMQWDGTTWGLASAGAGTVTSVSGTAPVSVATGTTTPVISINNLGITNALLAADAVTSAKILDGTIANDDLANGVGGIYKGSGSLAGATTVTQGANTLGFTSTAVNGFSVDGNTFSVDAANNRVGIGTSAPSTSLHLNQATAGAIRIADGLQAAGKVLTSDANGVGTWEYISLFYLKKIASITTNVTFPNLTQIAISGLSDIYTVQRTGYYQLNSKLFLDGFNLPANNKVTVNANYIRNGSLVLNNEIYLSVPDDPTGFFLTPSMSDTFLFNQGDTISVTYGTYYSNGTVVLSTAYKAKNYLEIIYLGN